MFSNEKELVEKLVSDLQDKYGTQYIVRELRGGNNIADIVYTTNISRNNIVFDEYFNAYYYFNNIYCNKRTDISEVGINDKRNAQKFYHFLQELEGMGYIKIENNYITSIKKVDAVTKKFTAIEAKLSDWRSGLEQAIRYKQYADEVYVAISSENISKVNRELFLENEIGLMGVSDKRLKIVIKAKKLKVENLDIQYYIADKFLKQLKSLQIITE